MQTRRPVSASTRSRPTTAGSSRSEAQSTAITSSGVPSVRIADNARHFKSMLLRRPLPSHAIVSKAIEMETFGDTQPLNLHVDKFGVRSDHLCVHRRAWTPQEVAKRLGQFRPNSAAKSGAAVTAQRQLAAFCSAHDGVEALDHDDPEDHAILVAQAEAVRKAEALGLKAKPPINRAARTKSNILKVTVASGESIGLKYLVALERLLHVVKTVPLAFIRRLLTVLEKQEGESVIRAGHESFKVIRIRQYLDRALAPMPPPPAQGADSSAASSPMSYSSSPSVTSPTAGPLMPRVYGAGLSKEEAQAVYDALDIFHDSYLAIRPTVAALIYVGGSRTVLDFVQFMFAALAAHNAMITTTDLLAFHRYATESVAPLRANALTMASLGRVDTAVRAASRFRGGTPAPEDGEVITELAQLRHVLFHGDRESVAWFEAVDTMGTTERFPCLYSVAILSIPPKR